VQEESLTEVDLTDDAQAGTIQLNLKDKIVSTTDQNLSAGSKDLTHRSVNPQTPLNIRDSIRANRFVITAEVTPPKGTDLSHMMEQSLKLKDRVNAINVTDGSRAVMRMSSWAACLALKQQGLNPVCQMTCRDRNRIALQADLIGMSALGLNEVLALTGDSVKAGDFPTARAVFDLESVRLFKLITQLNSGQDANEKALPDSQTDIFAGGAVDPQLPSWSSLERRFAQKIESGAQFFQSQLIMDFDRLEQFMDKIANSYGKPILAGIFLLKSAKNAQFINKNVPGVTIPDSIIERLAASKEPLREGMAIAAEQVQVAQQLCQGVHLMAVRREDLIPEILDMAGVKPLV
jgi:methylenetetrahydrofolate reductase (NADPH)